MEDRVYTFNELMDLASPDFAERAERIPSLFGKANGPSLQIMEIVNDMDPYSILPLICVLFDDFCGKAEIKNR